MERRTITPNTSSDIGIQFVPTAETQERYGHYFIWQ